MSLSFTRSRVLQPHVSTRRPANVICVYAVHFTAWRWFKQTPTHETSRYSHRPLRLARRRFANVPFQSVGVTADLWIKVHRRSELKQCAKWVAALTRRATYGRGDQSFTHAGRYETEKGTKRERLQNTAHLGLDALIFK